jgi:hypothetical protein
MSRQPSKISGTSISKAPDDPAPVPEIPPARPVLDLMGSPPVQPVDPITPRRVTPSLEPSPGDWPDHAAYAGPGRPVPPFTLRLKHDSGESGSDRLTRDATVLIEGLDPAVHPQWWYSIDGGPWRQGSGDTIPDEAIPGDGPRQVAVEATDALGHVIDVASLHVEVDRTPPDPQRHWVRLEGASGQFVNELGSPDPLGAYQLVTDATVTVGPLPQDVRWNYAIQQGAASDAAPRQEGRDGEIPHAAFKRGANELSLAFRDVAGNIADTMHLHHLYLDPPVL